MKNSTLDIWKELQANNYFEKIRFYNGFPLINSFPIDVKNKVIVEIGCGYGRATVYFSNNAKKVYAIDVSIDVFEKNQLFLERNGNINKVKFVLANKYKAIIPNEIDLVYSEHVFHHLTIEQIEEYIDFFYNKLKLGGIFYSQFLLGEEIKYFKTGNNEPVLQLPLKQVLELFKKYKIKNYKFKTVESCTKSYNHIYVLAIKNGDKK